MQSFEIGFLGFFAEIPICPHTAGRVGFGGETGSCPWPDEFLNRWWETVLFFRLDQVRVLVTHLADLGDGLKLDIGLQGIVGRIVLVILLGRKELGQRF